MDGLHFVANINKDWGKPGLLYVLQQLDKQQDKLSRDEQAAYKQFKEDLRAYVNANK